jgi:hypothetical protein
VRVFLSSLLIACAFYAGTAIAQEEDMPAIAPLPDTGLQRITPDASMEGDMLTTKKSDEGKPSSNAGAKPGAPSLGAYQPAMPFGRGESSGPAIPSGPHTTVAVPVVDVDAVETREAAPPTPPAEGENPADENPEEPTEMTAPLFEASGINYSRRVIIRLLNKVTGQSKLISFKPGESTKIGTMQITAVNCQSSSPKSQTDYAGLLDISEQKPGDKSMKSLFRGWMYASSPSITALEHPVYDVTMVECANSLPAPKKEAAEAPAEKPLAKTPAKKSKR